MARRANSLGEVRLGLRVVWLSRHVDVWFREVARAGSARCVCAVEAAELLVGVWRRSGLMERK